MKQLSIILILLVLLAWKKGKKSEPAPNPSNVVLISPASNSACTVGTVVSATESTVILTWNSSANTETYDVHIKNLITGAISIKPSSSTQLSVNLIQNTPYLWYVVSKSGQTTSTGESEAWKFYNAGVAASFYAPFPAELTLPANFQSVNATTGKTTLQWKGSDTDNDISGYDVYLGSNATNMVKIKDNIAESVVNDVPVSSGNTYYWKVLTKDSKGNTSTSEIYSFKVN